MESHALCDAAARSLLSRYDDLAGCEVEPLCYSENRTYCVRMASGMPVATLRLCRPGYRSAEQLQAEVGWLSELRRQGLPESFEVIEPLAARDGSFVQEVAWGEDTLFGLAFRYMGGVEPDEVRTDLPRLFRQLGAFAACLHGRQPVPELVACRDAWDWDAVLGPAAIWGDWRAFPGLGEAEREVFERCAAKVRASLEEYGRPQGRFGLIHSDMRFANLLVQAERIKLIDFDDCGQGWHLFDLAASLSFIEARPDVPQLIDAWLQGYRGIRPLDERDVAMIPTFVAMRRLQLTAWLASRPDSDPVPATVPGWLADTHSLCLRYLGE